MGIENPFITGLKLPQQISWKHLKDKVKYSFEIIQPLNGVIGTYKNKGAYLTLCGEVKLNQPLHVSEVLEGHLVMLDLPIRTFERAWMCIHHLFRSQLSDTDNVILTFTKHSKESMTIVKYEKLTPKLEHTAFANEQYKRKKERIDMMRKLTKVRPGEYL